MSPWLLAAAIVLFVEGAVIAVAPEAWRRTMRQLTELPSALLRKIGFSLVAAAFALLLLLWWGRA